MSASIEIPGRSSIHNSEQDFVVISESPVVQLSDGDVLDGLEVTMNSLGVQSFSLKDDIEKLKRENEQLKRTAVEDGQAIKKHLQLCTEYKDQMTKCHERDAAMLEEARQATLKLQDEKAALSAVLESVQCKLEKAVIEEFSLKQTKTKLETELQKLREELAESQTSAEEARQRADEASFVQIEGGPSDIDGKLRAQIAELESKLEETITENEKSNELIKQLQSQLEKAEEENARLRESKLVAEKQTNTSDHSDNITITTENLQDISRDSFNEGVQSQADLLELKIVELSEANEQIKALQKKNDELTESHRILQQEGRELEETFNEHSKDMIAAINCLKSEHASELQALKLALRSEQTLREKAETDYSSLLETWQSFERNNQPMVDVAAELATQRSSVDRAAQNLAAADRLRLEADNRTLRDTIRDLQAQNMRLLEDRQLNSVQQAGASSSRFVERRCPICMKQFDNQNDLIQHAGICDNELGTVG